MCVDACVNLSDPVAYIVRVGGRLLVVQARLRGETPQVVVGVGDYIHLLAVVGDGGGEQPLHSVVGHRVDVHMMSRAGGMLMTNSQGLAGECQVIIVMLIAPHGIAFMALNHIAMAVVVQTLDKHSRVTQHPSHRAGEKTFSRLSGYQSRVFAVIASHVPVS